MWHDEQKDREHEEEKWNCEKWKWKWMIDLHLIFSIFLLSFCENFLIAEIIFLPLNHDWLSFKWNDADNINFDARKILYDKMPIDIK